MFSMKEHELSLLGAECPRLEVDTSCTEVELAADCSLFERTIDAACAHNVEYARRINDLDANYSKADLELMHTFISADVFAAKGELLQAVAKGRETVPADAAKEDLEPYREVLSDLLIQKILIEHALELKGDESGDTEDCHEQN